MQTPLKILFLSAWYPHRGDDMEGLFVRKHALAAARFNQVDVIFVKAEEGLKLPYGQRYEYVETQAGPVHEHYFYYPKPRGKAAKIFRFFKVHRAAFQHYRKLHGKPDVIHVNVLTRCGAVARLRQLFHGIPYVITEHWTRYYFPHPFRHFLHRWLTRGIVRHAACVMPVSENLAQEMRGCGLKGQYQVVRNVVDDFFFSTEPKSEADKSSNLKTMVHVCCFCEEQKNNLGLLRAVKDLNRIRHDFRLVFVGDGPDKAKTEAYAAELGFEPGQIVFTGKLQPRELKNTLDKSTFMVAFSNYETASVVLYESLACGRPVVATRTGGIPEIVNPGLGILVEPGGEKEMSEALNRMLDEYASYKSGDLQAQAAIFSFDHVGKTLDIIYRQAIHE